MGQLPSSVWGEPWASWLHEDVTHVPPAWLSLELSAQGPLHPLWGAKKSHFPKCNVPT